MKKIGIIANPKRPRAADVFERLSRKAAELNLELYADQQTAAYLPAAAVIEFDQFAGTVDVLFALGGDGTVLFGANILKLAEKICIPLLVVQEKSQAIKSFKKIARIFRYLILQQMGLILKRYWTKLIEYAS